MLRNSSVSVAYSILKPGTEQDTRRLAMHAVVIIGKVLDFITIL